MIKKISFVGLAFILIAVTAYATFWFVMASKINEAVNDVYAAAAENNVVIEGERPAARGFPAPHTLTFSGRVITEAGVFAIPSVTLRGFPVPGRTLSLVLPEGYEYGAGNKTASELLSPDYIRIEGPLPEYLPAQMTVEDLRVWRDNGGKIHLRYFNIEKTPLTIEGQMTLQLDSELQPAVSLPARITGHMAFLSTLQAGGVIDSKTVLIAGAVLGSLTQEDPETGERFIQADIRIQNNALLVGPLELLDLPKITWPYRK